MDSKGKDYLHRLYEMVGDKAKVDRWIASLQEEKKTSDAISAEGLARLGQLKCAQETLSAAERKATNDRYLEDIHRGILPLFEFLRASRQGYLDTFEVGNRREEDRDSFESIYKYFSQAFEI